MKEQLSVTIVRYVGKGGMFMQDTQLMKGILEGCVLGVIAKGETYGYEILSELADNGFEDLLEGTLYPLLTRLEKNGYISCRKAKSPLGPIRKYYTITIAGKRYLNEFKENYRKVTGSADRVLFSGSRTGNVKEGDEHDGLQCNGGTA